MFLAELYGRNLQSPGWSKVPRLLDKSGLYDLGMCLELKVEPHLNMSSVCSGTMHDINFYASLLRLLQTRKQTPSKKEGGMFRQLIPEGVQVTS